MTTNRTQVFSNMSTRQKVIGVILILVIGFVIWEVMGLFSEEASLSPSATTKTAAGDTAMKTSGPTTSAMQNGVPGQPVAPLVSQLPQQRSQTITQREIQLIKLQEETEEKYIAAINELQMLKVEREIAENNKAIVSAKLDTVKAQKSIVTLLTPAAPPTPPPSSYGQGLVNPVASSTAGGQQTEVTYAVVSVSQLRYMWNAVLGYQSRLYQVSVGDVLPPDGSKVVSINQSGVVLEKNGIRKKVSLVPII